MRQIFLLVVVLIIYGSLYPFDFHTTNLPAGPLWILLHSWPGQLDRFVVKDGLLNILIYIPIGLFGALWMRGHTRGAASSLLVLAFSTVLSGAMEICQLFDDKRECSTADLATNVIGAAVGVALASAYGIGVNRAVSGITVSRLRSRADVFLLLGCWVGYQVYPGIPHLSTWQIGANFRSMWPTWPMAIAQCAGGVTDWLAVGCLLDALDQARVLPLMILLIPARLFILGRAFTAPELIGAVAASVVWHWLARYSSRTSVVARLATATLLLRGLAPFTWQSAPNEFSWVPFASFMDQDRMQAALVFLDKSFLYGTVLWLWHEAGNRLAPAAAGIAILLGLIEAIQIHLPGRTAELTDPVYALILALVLAGLGRSESTALQRK